MRRLTVAVGVVVGLGLAGTAWADRCVGPKDNTDAVGFGVDPIDLADITWCDDFDSYCGTNCGDQCNPTWPLRSIWPGYPPVPDNTCIPDALDPGGNDNELYSGYYFRRSYHWPRPTLYASTGVPAASWSSAEPGVWGVRYEGWDGNPGWVTDPYVLQYQGNANTNQYHTFDMVPAIQNAFPSSNALNGTDSNPLTLRFWTYPDWTIESPPNWPLYVELRLDDEQAPTDYIEMYCPDNLATYPIVCQQRDVVAGCPPLSTQTRASMAFGWLAQLDENPCDVDTGRKPTLYHAAVFDGLKWHELRSSMFAGQVDKFNYDTGQAYFEMKVKTTTVELKLMALSHRPTKTDPLTLVTSTATVPRQYLGPFNKISFGAGPGCKLDPNTGECLTPGQYDVWRYMQGNSGYGWGRAFLDRVALLGGVGDSSSGACCLPDSSCTIATSGDCTAADGVWRGINTTCETDTCLGACCEPLGSCTLTTAAGCGGVYQGVATDCTSNPCDCPVPRADFDVDGDVDMADFAGLQRCLTIGGGAVTTECACFDFDGINGIDATDVDRFIQCGTGEGIAWVATANCPQ